MPGHRCQTAAALECVDFRFARTIRLNVGEKINSFDFSGLPAKRLNLVGVPLLSTNYELLVCCVSKVISHRPFRSDPARTDEALPGPTTYYDRPFAGH